jgi:hypothetical protein
MAERTSGSSSTAVHLTHVSVAPPGSTMLQARRGHGKRPDRQAQSTFEARLK